MTATYLITTECMPTTTSSIVVNSTSKYILFLNYTSLNTQLNMLQYALHHCNIAHSCNMQQYVESQPTSSLQHTLFLCIILPRHAVFILNHFRMHPHHTCCTNTCSTMPCYASSTYIRHRSQQNMH